MGDGEDFETISKSETDVHVHIDRCPSDGDEPDFAKNPFGDREFASKSLYFDDGKRSVDYVLVWKKLVPKDDETEAKTFEIEKARTERREVFEENLLNEGFELESYVIDEEINFIKIHAPLEVLRRYAEILKLRMPMKEVSEKKIIKVAWTVIKSILN